MRYWNFRMTGFHISRHMLSVSAAFHILFYCHKQTVILCQFIKKIHIQWFHKSGIYKSRIIAVIFQSFTDFHAGRDHTSHSQHSDFFSFADNLTSAIFHRCLIFPKPLMRTASRIADCNRSVKAYRKCKHLFQFSVILRCQNSHIRHHGQITQIKAAVMGLSIASHQTGTIHGKYNRQILHTYIMKDLIKLMDPKYIEVWGKFTPRGGISIDPYCNYGKPGTKWEEVAWNRLSNHDLYPEKIDNR